jgi:hypothetical protein
MRTIFTLLIFALSFNSFSLDSTYLQCYGVKDNFEPRSDLIKKSWAVNPNNQYLKLDGYWKDNSYSADTENYFVVKVIDSVPVTSEQVHSVLAGMCSNTLVNKYSDKFISNITYFASNNSYGYEYPVITETDSLAINNTELPVAYNSMLRYAFASGYVYSTEQGAAPFPFTDNTKFKQLMVDENSAELNIIATYVGKSGVQGVAIKAPAVPSKNLEEEIIISFKGTSDGTDVMQDIELMLANLSETDKDWQAEAYQFTQQILAQYPANKASLTRGYKASSAAKTYNVVLTGHSLGAYTAIDAGVRTGILTRVFSSPATRIIEKYTHAFANKMRYNNVINMVREKDPVATMSGRHNENMIYFPEAAGSNPADSHYLTPFINDILIPLANGKTTAANKMSHVYITPDATTGAGLTELVNIWDHTN